MLWLLACAAVAVVGPAIIMSWSRGGWFGVAAALVVVGLGRGRRTAMILCVLALALAGLVLVSGADRFAPESLVTRLTDFSDYFAPGDVTYLEPNPANWAVLERLAHWQAAQNMFREHPWLGVGIGNYAAVYPAYRLPRWTDPLGHAHNYYLNVAAEAGLVGLGAYFLFWGAAMWLAARAVGRTAGVQRGLALGVLGMLAHLAVHNVFDNLFVQGIYLQVALWLGLIIPLTDRKWQT
jgi:putative inorganic carbon (hco3(-)) transporter